MTLRWVCEEKGCYKATLPDWAALHGCFPRAGIKPTDIDGMVHLAETDRFLFLEKKPSGKALDTGQRMALSALARRPGITSLVLRGAGQDVEEALWFPEPLGFQKADWNDVRRFCMAWSEGADGAQAWSSAQGTGSAA